MKKNLKIAIFITLITGISLMPAWSADDATEAAQVKLQSASVPKLRQSIANAANCDPRTIQIKHTSHQLTATIVNSKENGAVPVDREKAAIAIASAMEREIQAKPEFEGVASMHIDYVIREGKKVKIIQIFDFFRSPAGVFVLHKT